MKIAAFNIQRFGRNKASDPDVLKVLVQIISRYDIIVILEVVDESGKAVDALMKALNKEHQYEKRISTRLGRTGYKEQFLFLYRADQVTLVDCYQSDDQKTEGQDDINRDPYILRFSCPHTVLEDLVMIPVHITPKGAEKELDKLYDLFLHVKKKWKTENVMILGDFNADGSYVTKKEMKTIRIRNDKNFHWLIGDDVDTTASTKNTNTYDRIVVYGDKMLQAVVENSAKAFNFQEEYELSDEQALSISDHYPVEVELLGKKDGQTLQVRKRRWKDSVLKRRNQKLKRKSQEREKVNLDNEDAAKELGLTGKTLDRNTGYLREFCDIRGILKSM
ncbi:deoxyribonuclease-1-like isoform X2 [Poecilia formosa]|uniref:deoxyribonuclease-1-like isoform X2 n=1 Tax=Poecilia formosa TaxID=48698 RepID=UPI0007BA5678|nr:PREDICTED: deoxyribonuclease-1-like isoform X2 [Poecilia formosa]XP_016518199.1 PREDICTED: deoxyribonuclease-1-like isoform X2 [Poecilia formosa]